MDRPNIEVADIFREYSHLLTGLSKEQWKVVNAIINCRTEALGGHISECSKCDYKDQSYNSCRNRHCPKCQYNKKEKWVQRRVEELIPVDYFHTVFTIPHELNPLILQNKRICYELLFRAVSETLKEVAENPKYLGAKVGFFSILHTWGQSLVEHPHIHVVIPSGGINQEKKTWVKTKKKFLLPVKVLSIVFRGKYLSFLEKEHRSGNIKFHGRCEYLKEEKDFKTLLKSTTKKNWVVYIKKSFAGPKQVLNYLGNYTHRIAISNYRIKKIEAGKVHFLIRDYADNNKNKVMVLDVVEFMRRFLLHVLPRGFVRIRHYGILGSRFKKINIELARKSLEEKAKLLTKVLVRPNKEPFKFIYEKVFNCPICEGEEKLKIIPVNSFYNTS